VSKFSKYSSLIIFRKEKKNCMDLSNCQNLTEFAKVPTLESLKLYICFFKSGIFIILIRFNEKSL
jgi:hypothetical protein